MKKIITILALAVLTAPFAIAQNSAKTNKPLGTNATNITGTGGFSVEMMNKINKDFQNNLAAVPESGAQITGMFGGSVVDANKGYNSVKQAVKKVIAKNDIKNANKPKGVSNVDYNYATGYVTISGNTIYNSGNIYPNIKKLREENVNAKKIDNQLNKAFEEHKKANEKAKAEEVVLPLILRNSPVQMITMVVKKKTVSKIQKKTFECPGVVISQDWVVVSKYCGGKFMQETVKNVAKKPTSFAEFAGQTFQPQSKEYHKENITYDITYYISHDQKLTTVKLPNDSSMGDFYPHATKQITTASTVKAKISKELGDLVFINFGKNAFANVNKKASLVLHNNNGKLTPNTALMIHTTPSDISKANVEEYQNAEDFVLSKSADAGAAIITKSNCLAGFVTKGNVGHHISMSLENKIKDLLGSDDLAYVYLP